MATNAFLASLIFMNFCLILEITTSAEGHITPMNSSKSRAPSSFTSPSAKMASICSELNLWLQDPISCLVIEPSPSMSRSLNAALTSSMLLKVELSLDTTSVAEGYIRPMNSPMSISPSPLTSPSSKIALISSESNLQAADDDNSCLLMSPSLLISIFLKATLTSVIFLKFFLILLMTSEAEGLIRFTNSCRVISPSPSASPRLNIALTSMSV